MTDRERNPELMYARDLTRQDRGLLLCRDHRVETSVEHVKSRF